MSKCIYCGHEFDAQGSRRKTCLLECKRLQVNLKKRLRRTKNHFAEHNRIMRRRVGKPKIDIAIAEMERLGFGVDYGAYQKEKGL